MTWWLIQTINRKVQIYAELADSLIEKSEMWTTYVLYESLRPKLNLVSKHIGDNNEVSFRDFFDIFSPEYFKKALEEDLNKKEA